MEVFAYCSFENRKIVSKASGVIPYTSPPLMDNTFTPNILNRYDFLYFSFHGLPNQPYWYNTQWETALSAKTIEKSNLKENSIVFATPCHLPGSPMMQALFNAGAKIIVSGSGINYAGTDRIGAADLMGLYFRFFIQRLHVNPTLALRIAKMRLTIKRQNQAIADTLNFQLYQRA